MVFFVGVVLEMLFEFCCSFRCFFIGSNRGLNLGCIGNGGVLNFRVRICLIFVNIFMLIFILGCGVKFFFRVMKKWVFLCFIEINVWMEEVLFMSEVE